MSENQPTPSAPSFVEAVRKLTENDPRSAEIVDQIISEHRNPEYVAGVCQRCGIIVGSKDIHNDWHRDLTLAIRLQGMSIGELNGQLEQVGRGLASVLQLLVDEANDVKAAAGVS